MAEWKLKIDPGLYLSRHPHGPNSDLAREILDTKLEDYKETLE